MKKKKYNLLSDEELIEDIKRVAGDRSTLSSTEYDKRGLSSRKVALDRFGSWHNALERAGLKPLRRHNSSISDNELLKDLRRVKRKLKTSTITIPEYEQHGKYSSRTTAKRFGSFSKALEAAGLCSNPANRYSDTECYKKDSKINKASLRRKILSSKLLPYKCAICDIAEWRGQTLVLQVDHINGIATDNRKENLRLLCPNCHSQTPTYAGRRGAYKTNKAMKLAESAREDI